MFRFVLSIFLLTIISSNMQAQDSAYSKSRPTLSCSLPYLTTHKINNFYNQYSKLSGKTFIIPAIAVSYGAIAVKSPDLRNINKNILQDVRPNDLSKKLHIDNYLQYTPGAISLGMTALGVKGKQNMRDAALTYTTINIISTALVTPIKHLSHELRPDSSDFYSFPSGHTAEAFANAEFLRMEYGNKYPWLAVAGYAMAATTGYLRMYNNKHWFSDVLSGAAIGFCSARLGGWIYEHVHPKLFPDTRNYHRREPVF